MNWMATLYKTYDAILSNELKRKGLEPYFHKKEQCHIEIIIDGKGNFLGADSLLEEVKYGTQKFWKGKNTIIPITPKSLSGRTSGPAPYPLAEQIQYVAKDYPAFGGTKKSYFKEYSALLESWAKDKNFSHFKVAAIAQYIDKGTVVQDLLREGLLYVYNNDGRRCLIDKWNKQGPKEPGKNKVLPKPPLLKAVSGAEQGNAKIRWRVQLRGQPNDATWGDNDLVTCWQKFQERENKANGFCQIVGGKSFITNTHSKGIIPKVNDAKIISTPTDKSYLTYLGRFTDEKQPCGISFEISQKAHNALRWLIDNQGRSTDSQVYVSWAISSKDIPNPLLSSHELFSSDDNFAIEYEDESEQRIDHSVDLGESFAHRLNNCINGYWQRAQLDPNEQIVVMGFDSSTKGRMGIIYYRQLLASEFLERLEKWHSQFAWPQRYSIEIPDPTGKKKPKKKTIWPISSPAPRIIAEAAYGDVLKSNDSLRKSLIERIMPCIVDARPFPRDIMDSAVRRASNRNNSEPWEWQRNLGVACALFKGFYQRHPQQNQRRKYKMALEEDRTSRDYLYGRLLAIAERIEEMALIVADEKPRQTVASRLMQRFADKPYSTWLNIEKGIVPYQDRLKSKLAPLADGYKRLLDDVCDAFDVEEFKSPQQLSGEFLLGFHAQRKWLREYKLEKGKWVRKEQTDDVETESAE